MAEEQLALDRFVDRAGHLYTLPTVAVEVLKLTSQVKVDLAALRKCLLRDPALVGKILRVVNSSLFGLSRGVSDLSQALALLGTKSVRLLVLGFSLPDQLFVGIAGDILRRYWHHTALKAAAAREISETVYRLPGEEAFIAGLLQDLGMLVLIQQLGEPYVKFLDRAFAKAVDVGAAETVALGFDHIQLTERLLTRWGLPESFVAAIAVGNSPERMNRVPQAQRGLPQILHLADLLAGMLSEGRADWLGELLQVGRRYHQVSGTQLAALVGTLTEKVDELSDVLSLELARGQDYQQLFIEAQQRLAEAAENAAADLTMVRQSDAEFPQSDPGDEEFALLGEATGLTETAQRFSQGPGKKLPARVLSTATVSAALGTSSNAGREASLVSTAGAAPAAALQSSTASVSNSTHSTYEQNNSHTASVDAGSGQGPEMELQRQVTSSISACRQARRPLSLILVEIDRFGNLIEQRGHEEAQRLAQLVELSCGQIEHPQMAQLPIGERRFAFVLPNCDRPAACELGYQLLNGVRRLCQRHAEVADTKLSVSVGVATVAMPAKNFLPQVLVSSADRCLRAAQLSGGNGVKSIDVL